MVQVQAALELNPKLALAHNLKGLLKQSLGRPAEAIAAFDQAIELRPNDAIILGNRGRAHMGAGRFAAAIQDFDRAIAQAPKQANLRFQRAIARRKTGDHPGAIEDLDQVAKLSGNNSEAHYLRGRSLEHIGKSAEAVEAFSTALAQKPAYASALLWRGLTRIKISQNNAAKKDLERFLKLAPKSKHRANVEARLAALEP